jgi:hypothetical protein
LHFFCFITLIIILRQQQFKITSPKYNQRTTPTGKRTTSATLKAGSRRRHLKSSYADSGPLVAKDKAEFGGVGGQSITSGATTTQRPSKEHRRSRKDRVSPAVVTASSSLSSASGSSSRMENGSSPQYKINKPTSLTVETKDSNCSDHDEYRPPRTPTTAVSSPMPTNGLRGNHDLRSPGAQQTPAAKFAKTPENGGAPIPDFITQTDASGNAITPRSAQAIEGARKVHPSGPKPNLHVNKNGKLSEDDEDEHSTSKDIMDEACTTVLDSIRFMCCCLIPPDTTDRYISAKATQDSDDKSQVKLLGELHPDDTGKKCLVLDLDETLVHSSFRAVPGADFVIPVQVRTCVCISSSSFCSGTTKICRLTFTHSFLFLLLLFYRLKTLFTLSMLRNVQALMNS